MDSYKASKAWHFGHSLAIDVHKLVGQFPESDEFQLAVKMRQASATAPTKIAESIEHVLQHERLECYRLARQALQDLEAHLALARDVHYIDRQTHDRFAAQAIKAHRLLTALIQSSRQSA